jgi:aminoglycoside phosphotransferase (APT) family kinase protein
MWIDGDDLAAQPLTDLAEAASRLGQFVAALQRIDTAGAPPSIRPGPVSALDDRVRREITDRAADGTLDAGLATAAWQTALTAPPWTRPPVWVHADLLPTNLLGRNGRLAAVIDFGCADTGDPAIDLLPAWTLLTPQTRDLFRAEADVDDATWIRGRGWAVGLGIGAAHFYRDTNPVLAAAGQYAIHQVLADYQLTG